MTTKEEDQEKQVAYMLDLWKKYKEEGSMEAREQLILHYSPLVKYVAGRVSANLPSNLDQGDLVSYGVFGLIDAIEKFDHSRGIKFETYAISRIRGSIIDELRSLDWVPRSLRQRAKDVERAYLELENKYKRLPSDSEVAAALNISVKEFSDLLSDLSHSSLLALEELWSVGGEKDEKVSLMETLVDSSGPDPSEAFEVGELKETLADSIGKLPEREKTVIALYYYDGLTFKEIGKILGVTESRISQLHTKAVLRLRARLRSNEAIFPS